VFPAGPLRERLADGLARASGVVILRRPRAEDGVELDWLKGFTRPILHAQLTATGDIPRGKLVAFAGLARPEKFFDTLTALGGELSDAIPYSDHHPYSDEDFSRLMRLAEDHGATLITTEKDAVRLAPVQRARVAVLPVTARFDDEVLLDALLAPIRSRMTGAHG
jgi:tetraacyldisaccharide 4'-kinase